MCRLMEIYEHTNSAVGFAIIAVVSRSTWEGCPAEDKERQ
jgi:hypothetical protein